MAPRAAPDRSATKNAIQYELPLLIRVEAIYVLNIAWPICAKLTMPAPRQTMTRPNATRANMAPRDVPEESAAKKVFINTPSMQLVDLHQL